MGKGVWGYWRRGGRVRDWVREVKNEVMKVVEDSACLGGSV